ncbi:hypothetical protein L484_007157 [Morus notabilis]|uniref:Uncharacterized protein n=1 Tax=Morus notabilis TaxID=981085 RepID=W9RZD7_9ROSA|nr:hypothetical protein L484_007157 [Morus notabilis]
MAEEFVVGSTNSVPMDATAAAKAPNSISAIIPGWFSEISPMWPEAQDISFLGLYDWFVYNIHVWSSFICRGGTLLEGGEDLTIFHFF